MSQINDRKADRISLRRLPSIRTGITLIWFQDPPLFSKQSDEIVNRLRSVDNCYLFYFKNASNCFKYLKRARSYERILVVMDVCNTSTISGHISRLSRYRQIQTIFLMISAMDKDKDLDINLSDNTREEMDKIHEIFHDYQVLLERILKIIQEMNGTDDNMFTFSNRSEKALRNLDDERGPYIWSQSCKAVVSAMPHNSPEAKREMLAEWRAWCLNRPEQLRKIEEFSRTYRPADAILWYTKPCSLHQLVNRALRSQDNIVLYKLRYFIVDLCNRLEEEALTSVDNGKPFRVYRGAKLSRDEVRKLKIGSLVAPNGFFSTSRNLEVAQSFIGSDSKTSNTPSLNEDDRLQNVLFEIDVDLTVSSGLVVTDVSSQSALPDENEILFNLGTTFSVTNIYYEENLRIWQVGLIPSSDMVKISRTYITHIQTRFSETKPIIMFGHLLCEMSSDYRGALEYFHRLLRSLPWEDEDRCDVYHYMGRAYRALGKKQKAMACFRCALLLQQRRLPESSFTYGRALSCIGTIYAESGDFPRAIRVYEKAMVMFRQVLPKTHYEFGFHTNRLGHVYWQNGQYEAARDLLMNTISFVRETMPEDSPGQAQTFYIMGLVQHSLNNREQAISYFEQSLKMRGLCHASDHPYAARTYYELSILYAEKNDYSTALNYARRALVIRESKFTGNNKELKQSVEQVQRLSQHMDNITPSSS